MLFQPIQSHSSVSSPSLTVLESSDHYTQEEDDEKEKEYSHSLPGSLASKSYLDILHRRGQSEDGEDDVSSGANDKE